MTVRWSSACLVSGLLMIAVAGCKPTAQPSVNKLPFSEGAPPSSISAKVLAANGGLASRVSRALSTEPKLRNVDISIEVSNLTGVVTLKGKAITVGQIKLAGTVAQAVAGKVQVVNHLSLASIAKQSGKGKKVVPVRQPHP